MTSIWEPCVEAAFIPIISLGSWCGVKAACRGMGIMSPTLPFDWVRLSLSGVFRALRHDFQGFLEYNEISHHSFAHPNGEVFVAEGHSFWHEDMRDEEALRKYGRRIGRFRELLAVVSARRSPVIFVRAVATTLELQSADELLSCLAELCAPAPVRLLLLLDAQPATCLIHIEDRPSLLIGTVSRHVDAEIVYSVSQPPYVSAYHPAIASALELTAGRSALAGLEHAHASTFEELLAVDGFGGRLRHVSLSEDLREPWSHDPHMPPQALVQRAMAGPEGFEKSAVASMLQAHVEALLG